MGHCDSSASSATRRDFSAISRAAEPDSARQVLRENGQRRPSFLLLGCLLLPYFSEFYNIFLSPFFGGACKYHPSCSNYAREAIEVHGAARARFWL